MPELEYILGTHDEEVDRLALQHLVWRPHVLAAWRRAGLNRGQTALDIGCGPGDATMDLAAIVGRDGSVVAVDQSDRFLERLQMRARQQGVLNIKTVHADLNVSELPDVRGDFAWCRWIFAFVRDPRTLLQRIAAALRPGGTLVIHEYFDYSTWRMLPACPELEDFVTEIMESWRSAGGEPDIGRRLSEWMHELGLQLVSARPRVHLAAPGEPMWRWPEAFLRSGLDRLVSLGRISRERASAIQTAVDEASAHPAVRMCTPALIEVIARR